MIWLLCTPVGRQGIGVTGVGWRKIRELEGEGMKEVWERKECEEGLT